MIDLRKKSDLPSEPAPRNFFFRIVKKFILLPDILQKKFTRQKLVSTSPQLSRQAENSAPPTRFPHSKPHPDSFPSSDAQRYPCSSNLSAPVKPYFPSLEKRQPSCLSSDQEYALNFMKSGRNCFITGGAGTGKSFLISKFINNCDKNIVLCAPTGVAAYNIKGVTIHSLFGLEVKEDIYNGNDIEQMRLKAKNYDEISSQNKRMETLFHADILIIDEISMCRGDMFKMIMAFIEGMEANKKYKRKLQIIVVGDFYQLPPVLKDKDIIETQDEETGKTIKISPLKQYAQAYGDKTGYAFLTPEWQFERINLSTIHRQESADFCRALNQLREGKSEGYNFICKNSAPDILENAIWLCGLIRDANNRNESQLSMINGKTFHFKLKPHPLPGAEINASEVRKEAEKITNGDLEIKIGCEVMAYVNSYNNGELQYANGMRGIVKDVNEKDESVQVNFENGKCLWVARHQWEIKRYVYDAKTKKLKTEVVAKFSQIPLVLGYAITVHKSQGQTLSAINVDEHCSFAKGQLYVALSRVKDVKRIYIKNKEMKPRTSEEVKKFMSLP